MSVENKYDVIIVGGGPAGLSAAVYAKRAGLKAVVIEKDYMGSGQIAASDRVDNYLGLPGISGYELGEKFHKHAEDMGADFLEAEVTEIMKTSNGFNVSFKDGRLLNAENIIYAAGTSYRHLGIPGEEKMGVSFCAVCDGAFYKDKKVAVIGGGDTALGDAEYLSEIAEKVYLVHRRNEFKANKNLQEKIKNTENIELVLSAEPIEILGDKRVEQLIIKQNGEKKILDVSGIFVAVGSVPNTQAVEGLCELDEQGYIKAGENCKTSCKGIFAAGDVRTTPLRQVITAVSDGAVAVQSIIENCRQ